MTAAPSEPDEDEQGEHDEPHGSRLTDRLNWLRAGVLGANDGIVSTAALVIGVAAATDDRRAILTAGLAGLAAGAMSMAAGEYVSVSTQRDTEKALIAKEKRELREEPEAELAELTEMYAEKGLPHDLAQDVAVALTKHDALAAHAEVELGIEPGNYTNPWQAAVASFVSFSLGALLPLLAIINPHEGWRIPLTVLAVVLALTATGWLSARLGHARPTRAILRNVGGGLLAMAVTYGIGALVGTQMG